MSFQYIHTSAKRGLEPGKSGFCCVARDRDIPPDLVSELESQSRYTADSKGGYPLVLRHRIATLRSGRYHILSHIHESGVDYSKRNNHLAHHLAFTAAEATGLPNPAAILLNWRGWREQWDEPPRTLEAFEAFTLHDFESFWASPNSPSPFREIIADGIAYTAHFNISPHQEKTLIEHLRRTINNLSADQRWTHTFTSCLLPTDQPQDYAWSGLHPHLPLPFETDPTSRPLSTPKTTQHPKPKTQPPSPSPSPIPEPSPQNPAPPTQPKTTPAAAILKKAPTVEIPADYDPRARKRPKRPFGSRELSRAINIAIAGGTLICIALVFFFVQSHKSSNLAHLSASDPQTAAKALYARQTVWQSFASSGYPRAELDSARATAAFLAKAGETAPTEIIAFLDQLLTADPAKLDVGLPIPTTILQHDTSTTTLPLTAISYPTLKRLALIPASLAPQLQDLASPSGEPSPLTTLPATSFSPDAFATSLDSYLLQADSPYHALPPQTTEALQSYQSQKAAIQENLQFAPILALPATFDLPPSAAYIAFDERGLLLANSPMPLAAYLRELVTNQVARSKDLALQSSIFQSSLDQLQASPLDSPLESANAIHRALATLDLSSRPRSDPWRQIREQWQHVFIRPDLMEQTILGYTLEALEAAKLRLAETRSRFSQNDLALHQESQNRATLAQTLKRDAIEAASSKEWIVISKQSTKVPNSLP